MGTLSHSLKPWLSRWWRGAARPGSTGGSSQDLIQGLATTREGSLLTDPLLWSIWWALINQKGESNSFFVYRIMTFAFLRQFKTGLKQLFLLMPFSPRSIPTSSILMFHPESFACCWMEIKDYNPSKKSLVWLQAPSLLFQGNLLLSELLLSVTF